MFVFLTGFSFTGKSQVGRLTARLLGWEFVDTDALVEEWAGKPVPDIFAQEGERHFRTLEEQALREAMSRPRRVVATGGGIVVGQANRSAMLERGLVVCLEATPETILQRLRAEQMAEGTVRPLLQSEDPLARIRELKSARQPFYALAHWTVHTDHLTVEETAREVVRAWHVLGVRLFSEHARDPDLAGVVTHSAGSYPVLVGWGLLDTLGERLKGLGVDGPVYLITDENILPTLGRRAQVSLESAGIATHLYAIPPGEASKTLDMAGHIYSWLAELKAERRHAVVALGGGVVGDLAGFVSATYVRGMPLVQVPTSLLAMVDASIGGKVAVDLPHGKNLVGAFHQPLAVVADVSALTSLGRRELAEGWAEAIKHGLILDADLFRTFEERAGELSALVPEVATPVIRRSVAIKARVVSQDERETLGVRTLLNYGHTIGHALEQVSAYRRFLHGEAVAVGMMGAGYIGVELEITPPEVVERQRALLERFGLPTSAPGVDPDALLEAMSRDKKTEAGQVRWVLLRDVGHAITYRGVPPDLVRRVLERLTAG